VLLLLELCGGGTLADVVDGVRKSGAAPAAAELLALLGQLGAGLAHLHAQPLGPVVHHDVKLENCLLSVGAAGAPPRLQLCDFGSARVPPGGAVVCTERAEILAEEGFVERFTSPLYRPPEMVDLYRGAVVDERVRPARARQPPPALPSCRPSEPPLSALRPDRGRPPPAAAAAAAACPRSTSGPSAACSSPPPTVRRGGAGGQGPVGLGRAEWRFCCGYTL
jgi:serine/threonine protein kinase